MTEQTITKEMVEEKLRLYQTELQQLFKLVENYNGAIQTCNHFLSVLESKHDDNLT